MDLRLLSLTETIDALHKNVGLQFQWSVLSFSERSLKDLSEIGKVAAIWSSHDCVLSRSETF